MFLLFLFIFSVFTFSTVESIICPSWYSDNLCLKLEDSKEIEKAENDYCLKCTFKYRKCEEKENFEEIYCNPKNGLCELNETEFNALYDFDFEKEYEESICDNFTIKNKSKKNKDLEIGLSCVIVFLALASLIMIFYIFYKRYDLRREKRFIEERKLDDIHYIEKANSESGIESETDSESGDEIEINLENEYSNEYSDNVKNAIIN